MGVGAGCSWGTVVRSNRVYTACSWRDHPVGDVALRGVLRGVLLPRQALATMEDGKLVCATTRVFDRDLTNFHVARSPRTIHAVAWLVFGLPRSPDLPDSCRGARLSRTVQVCIQTPRVGWARWKENAFAKTLVGWWIVSAAAGGTVMPVSGSDFRPSLQPP